MSSEVQPSLVVNPAIGNEPVIMGGHFGLAVGNELHRATGQLPPRVVIPVVSERQATVLRDEFAGHPAANRLVISDSLGRVMEPIISSQADFSKHMDTIRRELDPTSNAVNQLVGRQAEGSFDAHQLMDGQPLAITADSVTASLATGGRVNLDTSQSFFMFPAFLSELIASSTTTSSNMAIAARIMRSVESRYDEAFVPLVNTLSHQYIEASASSKEQFLQLLAQPLVVAGRSRTFTPPFKPNLPAIKHPEIPKPGIYAMLSGTDNGLEQTIQAANSVGLDVYTVPWMPAEIKNVYRVSPRVLNDPNIVAILGRAGFGTGWQALNREAAAPWLVNPHQPGDDPEIQHNIETIEALGIGAAVDFANLSTRALAHHIDRSAPRLQTLRSQTEHHFGTVDGIQYVAERIARQIIKA